MAMNGGKTPEPQIFSTAVNNFHYLYQDAGYLHGIATKPEMEPTFEKTQLSRTAIVLYIVSLEALINRAMEAFVSSPLREFFLEREQRFELKDKWRLLPLLAGGSVSFDEGKYPWSHFKELVDLRNDYLHPKHARMAYLKIAGPLQVVPLDWNEIPEGFPATETDIVYRQTRIPRDPYSVRPVHVDAVKKVVDDTVKELDRLLGGKVTEDWLHQDQLKLIWPPGAQLNPPSVPGPR